MKAANSPRKNPARTDWLNANSPGLQQTSINTNHNDRLVEDEKNNMVNNPKM